MADIDLRYARDLLLRMNELKSGGKSIAHYFTYGEYTLWQFYQEALFADLKVFSKTRLAIRDTEVSLVHQLLSGALITLFSIPGFLISCIKKPTIFLYSVDRADGVFKGDTRIEEVFRFLIEENISFREILHSSNGTVQRHNFWKRGRAPLYSEALDFLFAIGNMVGLVKGESTDFLKEIDWQGWQSSEEIRCATRLLKKYAALREVSCFKMAFYKKLFWILKPEALFAIDDGRQYYFELLLATREAGVPSFAFQHGHFTKYQVGWQKLSNYSGAYVYPDTYMLWSSYWAHELARFDTYIPKEAMKVGGAKTALTSLSIPESHKELRIIIPYETIAPHRELIPYIEKLVSLPQVVLTFKLRPDMDTSIQMEQYGLKEMAGKVEAVHELPLPQNEYDMVLGVYSSYLYDMIAFGVPVGLLRTSFDYGEGMVNNGLANKVTLGELEKDIQKLAEVSSGEREERRVKLFGKESKRLYETLVALGKERNWYV